MLYRTVRNLLYAALLMPLLIWSAFLFPFITTKALYFRLVIEAALFFYLILIWRHPEYRPRWNLPVKAVWLYVGAVFLAAIFGVDFGTSFMGTVERGEGIVTLLHFAAYFTMLTGIFRTKEEWGNYLLFAVSVTAAVAIYGFLQILGLTGGVHQQGARISGTIGNAAFFAAYLLFGIFLSLFLLREAGRAAPFWQRVYLWSVFGFELVLFYLSQTRGAVLAVLIAVLIWAIWAMLRTDTPRRLRLAAGATIVVLLAGAAIVYAARSSDLVRNQSTLRRLTTISRSNITTQTRLLAWRASWQGLSDRPVLGYGYENYNVAFNKYFPPGIYMDSGSQIWFDRAHNIFFDITVTSGILGLAAYLGIFVAAGWTLLRNREGPINLRAKTTTRGPAILALLLLAYFLQNLFVFDTQATHLMFFLVLAHAAFLAKPQSLPRGIAALLRPARARYAGIALLVLLPPIAYFVNLEPAAANIQTTRGIKEASAGAHRQAFSDYKRGLSWGTYMDRELRQRLAESAMQMIAGAELSAREKEELYQFTLRELRKSVASSPRDVKNHMYLMNFLNRVPSADPAAAAAEALALLPQAEELSSSRPQLYFEAGQAYFTKKDFPSGFAMFQKAIDLNPLPVEPHLNMLFAGIVGKRADLLAREAGVLNDLGYEFTLLDYAAIANAFVSVGDKEQTLAAYQRAVKLAPDNVQIHAKLAVAYGDLCRVAEAQRESEIVQQLDPAYAVEARDYIQNLEKTCKKK